MNTIKAQWQKLWDIDNKRATVVSALLSNRGWHHTSNTIGSYWMWKKEIDGITYMVNQQTALRIQSTIDEADIYDA